ncbi:MAG: peroxiredoxin, partial [Gammaproteobacteria bacterium]|nr:peroxiredoxin [Gammaproteobacteria bacterium]NDE55865.1 peroxiredoxin [Gammaproteobacteria bacterium]NDG87098.1 peroxiredoxin [Gammaproteobacteria bacterium]
GKQVQGIERSTFVIGPDLKLLAEWRKVSVKGHVLEVLEAMRSLQGISP